MTTHRPVFLSLIRQLAETYQAFEQLSSKHIRVLGLTPPQFDVIVTLGNTSGMSCKTLSQKTLITKGTLTGILDRLEEKTLVQRAPVEEDRRSVFVSLTQKGETLFQKIFPEHLNYLAPSFEAIELEEQARLVQQLRALQKALKVVK